jgi:hypothetical protein
LNVELTILVFTAAVKIKGMIVTFQNKWILYIYCMVTVKQKSTVVMKFGIVTGCCLDNRKVRVQVPVGLRIFILSSRLAQPASCPMVTGGFFS